MDRPRAAKRRRPGCNSTALMKDYLRLLPKCICLLSLLLVTCVAFPPSAATADDTQQDVIVGEDDGTGVVTSITLVWDANAEPDLAGYNLYYGPRSGDYLRILTVYQPTATVKVRGNRTVYFAATAFNTAGLESELSDEVHWP